MKAAVYSKYGPPSVVSLAEVPDPQVGDREVLIRIYATTVSSGDYRARTVDVPGFGPLGRLVFGVLRPRQPILGTELSGVIESVGPLVTRFKPGDEVIAFTGSRYGCHAEYRTMQEDGLLALKPRNLSFEEAVSLPFGAMTALPFLRDKAKLKRGERVLVVGASGSVGTAAVQIAKHVGAHVTGVTSTGNLDLVRSIGADRVIDYKKTDFATTEQTWDIILDTTGTVPFARCERVLSPGGRLVAVMGTLAQALGIGGPSKASGKHVIAGVVPATVEDLLYIAELASSGQLKPVIDRVYQFNEVAAAHAQVDTGRKRGSVVIRVRPNSVIALAA